MIIKKRQILIAILVIVFIISILPWLKQGTPTTDDYRHHASRVFFIKEEINQLKFSEWVPNMYNGWPFFHFYHPLFYIMIIPIALFSGPLAALKIATVIAYVIALFGTFYAAKLLFKNDDVALISAIVYFMSSHFLFHATVSGALPRLVGIAMTPLTLALFIKALEENNKKYWIFSGILLAAQFMMHTSVAVPVFLLCGIYLLYDLYLNKNVKPIVKGIIIFAIALGLSAAWFLPLMMEKDYSSLSESTAKIEAPLLKQTFRTFGIVHDGTNYVRSNYFGYSTLVLALLGLFFIRKNKTVNYLKVGFITSIILYFNLLGFLDYIPFVNTALTGTTSFFISVLVFNAAMLAGVAGESLAKKFKNDLIIYACILIIFIELYPGLNAFSYGWNNGSTENYVNPTQLIQAWDFIKNQDGQFAVFSAVGQAAEIYHEKNEFGFDWVGCPQCVQEKTYSLHNKIWTNFTKGIKDDAITGYLGVKYYVVPCQDKMNNKLAFTNNAACVYENEQFRPLIDSDANISDVKWNLESVSFKTVSEKGTDVIIKVNYFKPHWHIYVNGKETQITEVWPEFMSVKVPQGTNEVEVAYKTNSTHIVAWFITFLTAILIVYYIRK